MNVKHILRSLIIATASRKLESGIWKSQKVDSLLGQKPCYASDVQKS